MVHITPGPEFDEAVHQALPRLQAEAARADWTESTRREVADYLAAMEARAGDKLYRRLGWMPRARPFLGRNGRILVPLYHDGFSFSLMAWTDDAGAHWSTGRPVIGGGNIQPSIVRRSDGSLYTVMRDNGPPPKRVLTWATLSTAAAAGPLMPHPRPCRYPAPGWRPPCRARAPATSPAAAAA